VGAAAPELPKFLRHLIADLGGALATGEPVEKDGCEGLANGDTVLYRSILLPFVDLHLRRRYALGAVTYRLTSALAGG
jgi:hypothetical protein